jgi:hypothetical protein
MTASSLSDAEYHQHAQAALAAIERQVDLWLDDDLIDIDSHRTGGLLELALPGGSKLIINTNRPCTSSGWRPRPAATTSACSPTAAGSTPATVRTSSCACPNKPPPKRVNR